MSKLVQTATDEMIKEAKKYGISKQEINELLQLAPAMSEKIIKTYLLYALDEKYPNLSVMTKESAKETGMGHKFRAFNSLKSRIEKGLVIEHTGSMIAELQVSGELNRMNIKLCIANKDDDLIVHIPSEYEMELPKYILRLLEMARSYYAHILKSLSISGELNTLFPNDDLSNMIMDKERPQIYLFGDLDKRIGVLCYYIDDKGNPIENV